MQLKEGDKVYYACQHDYYVWEAIVLVTPHRYSTEVRVRIVGNHSYIGEIPRCIDRLFLCKEDALNVIRSKYILQAESITVIQETLYH